MTPDAFAASRGCFEALCTVLGEDGTGRLEHGDIEARLAGDGRELLRQLMQDHLDLRAVREQRLPVVRDAQQVAHATVETGHQRPLTTIFGQVQVNRMAYRARDTNNLYPADAGLNLPLEKHSHGLRRMAAVEASRGSYDEDVQAIERASGQRIGKRQVEQLAIRAAADFNAFYTTRQPPAGASSELLVLSCDGKGIVMRPDALRPATAKAAAKATGKLATRLSKGEKRNRKRLAELGVVYDATPAPRSPDDILPATAEQRAAAAPGPDIANKWLTASVVDQAAAVVGQIFDEAQRRDPGHTRTWIALVDGNNHQIDRINTEADDRGIQVPILIDFIHVVEYLSAPRKRSVVFPAQRGEIGGKRSLGPMAYLASKEKGDNSMPLNQWSRPGAWGGASEGPRDMAKARLPEPQFPEGAIPHPPERHLKPVPAPASGSTDA